MSETENPRDEFVPADACPPEFVEQHDGLNAVEDLAREEILAPASEEPSSGDADTSLAAAETVERVDSARILHAIRSLGSEMNQRMGFLQALFEREIRAEATRERVVDRLHAELQDYKQDLLLKVQRPIFIDLIQLHDDIGKMIEARPADGPDPDRTAVMNNTLESIRTAIEDILYRQGVEPFRIQGEEFDPTRQRAVSTVATENLERNKTIATRLRPGFQAGDKLIRPEIVAVYTFKK